MSFQKMYLLLAALSAFLFNGNSWASEVYLQADCQHSTGAQVFQPCWGGGPQSTSNGTYVQGDLVSHSLGGGDFVTNNSFSVVSEARANYGMLGVSAFASVKNLFNSGADYLTRYAVAQPFAVWHDKFTVQSSALAIGTPVTVQITQVIDIAHALASSSDFFYLEPMAGGLISFMSSYAPAEYCIATGRYGNGRFGYDFCSGKQALMEGSNMITYESVFRVGQVVDWSSMLHAEANVEIEGSLFNKGIGVGSVLMDAIHTAQTYFSVADASTNLAWESGHDYTVPVPEPETYAMMLAGLGLIGAAVKRRRSKQA